MIHRLTLRRGFTLVEWMAAMAILAILASLSVTFMVYGGGRARVNNALFDLAALYSTAQLRALSHGVPHYIVLHQDAAGRIRAALLERPDARPTLAWNALDLTQGPEVALAFERTRPDGALETVNAPLRDQLTLGASSGPDSGGIAFLDLDSARLQRPLPAPFNTIALTTPSFTPADPEQPSRELLAGCSFCVEGAGLPYGVIRFNTNGTVEVPTGAGSSSGGALALMPDTLGETHFAPRLLSISAPAGAVRIFQEVFTP
jgi:prepilin-type N-terminal cleavage/methylation domain-containing protein